MNNFLYGLIWLPALCAVAHVGAADIERDEYGRTELMRLVAQDETTVEQVQSLLAAGADLHARDNDGNTVLMRAARIWWYAHEMSGDDTVLKFLVTQGVDVHARNKQGLNALEVAMCGRECDSKVLSWLRSLGLESCLHAELMKAAGHDDPAEVKRLLAAGADPNYNRAAALWLSLSAGTYGQLHEAENVLLLLAAGAEPQLCAEEILHCACHGAAPLAIELILARGVDFSAVDADRSSDALRGLWLGLEEGRPKPLFHLLVQHGARLTGRCRSADPLLCMVVKDPKQGAREVSYLLAAGVDPTQQTMDGKTALDLARELNRQDLVPLLQAAMPLPAAPPARGK